MNWMILLLSALGVFRLAHMVAKEDGPFDVFIAVRHRVGQHNWIGRGLNCVLCISFWLSLIPSLWLASAPAVWAIKPYSPSVVILIWMGIAGAVVFLYKVSNDAP